MAMTGRACASRFALSWVVKRLFRSIFYCYADQLETCEPDLPTGSSPHP